MFALHSPTSSSSLCYRSLIYNKLFISVSGIPFARYFFRHTHTHTHTNTTTAATHKTPRTFFLLLLLREQRTMENAKSRLAYRRENSSQHVAQAAAAAARTCMCLCKSENSLSRRRRCRQQQFSTTMTKALYSRHIHKERETLCLCVYVCVCVCSVRV